MDAIGYEDKPEAECFVRLQEQLGGFVEAQLAHLDRELGRRRRLLHDAPMMREHRDDLAAELYDLMVALRKTISGTFGTGYETQLFGKGKTPRDPFTLANLAGTIAHRLRNPELRKQLSGHAFTHFDWDVVADDLGGKAARLEEMIRDLDTNAAGQTSAVRRKDAAAEEFDRTQKGMFKVLEGLMEMAGMDDMARRLRPREPSQRVADGDRATSEGSVAVETVEEAMITPLVAHEETDRAEIAASGGSASGSDPSIAPLHLVASASEAMSTGPDTLGSTSGAGIPASESPAAAERPRSSSSGLLRASPHPVRTASDPPGGASHRVSEDSEEVEDWRHAV